MQEWEYAVKKSLDEYELDILGLDGWELVSVILVPGEEGGVFLFFKRPRER